MIEYAAMRSGDPEAHDVMFVRVRDDRTETPAAAPDADVAAYCTARAAMYEDLAVFGDQPVDAIFDIDRVLGWLDWHGDDPLTVTFEGDPATGRTQRLLHETADADVVIPCETDWSYDDVSLGLPERFDDDRLLGADGDPVPTVVSTDASELRRLVRASQLAGAEDEYEIRVTDGELVVEVRDEAGTRVSATLSATVSGPDVETTVLPGFERVVSSLVGPVELQTGPGEPVAVVRPHETFSLRFLVARA